MLSDILFRLRSLVRRNAVENELDDELQFHLEQQVEKHMHAGLTREEAMRQTRLEFGGLGQVKEDCRESRGVSFLQTTTQDIRYALRQLRRTPGFTATVLLTLALGIGANSAIFTLVNAVLEKNLPVADPKMLVRLGDTNDCCVGKGLRDSFSYFSTDAWQQFRKNLPEFEDLAAMQAGFAYRPIIARREGTQEPARSVMGEFVSGNYFRTFGLQPHAGRLFNDNDDLPGAPSTAVISYENWQTHFAGDPSIVGSTFRVNTKPVTIIGIAPRNFFGDRLMSTPPDYYLPIQSMPLLANVPYVHNPQQNWLYIIGRVKPGIALGPLQQKITTLLRNELVTAGRLSPQTDKEKLAKIHVVLTPGGAGIQLMQEQYGDQLHLLMGISGLVLLIACANIANLLLVRGIARSAEMSVRTALGAMRGRIIRQLLTESVLLAGLGGIAGLVVAYAGTRMILALAFPGSQNLPIQAGPSLAVVGFASAISLITGVVFGLAPAWITSKAKPADALRSGSRTTVAGASLLQRSLVVFQLALSLVLLVGACLFLQSLSKLENSDLKLDAANRYIVHINPQAAGYVQTQLDALYHTMEDRFHALPGVTKVGIASYTPMEDNNNGWGVQVHAHPENWSIASVIRINGDYFDSVGTHVLQGRGITAHDGPDTPRVAVVNQTFVNKMFRPGENPIGQRFGFPGPDTNAAWEIVGVVEDTVYESVRMKDHLMFFIPTMQRPAGTTEPIDQDDSLFAGAIVVATDRPMPGMESVVQTTLMNINPNLTVVNFQTFSDQIAATFSHDRLITRLTLIFGSLALLLAAIGLYGVTAYSVARRAPEIGIRMALGAERSGVIAMVMRGAMIQTFLGLAIGVPVALLCVRFVKSQLYEITSANPTVLISAVATLAIAACIAGIMPARRAASIDPVKALRMD
ncbi:MAG TPA: ABC transporter permease [Terracidiphilus sp.]|jgi:macrolide transport system ATP-binding/permease protein|nr:ABC transporter permease [Terracidiphilus sp.]